MKTKLKLYTSGFAPKDILLYQYLKIIALVYAEGIIDLTNNEIAIQLQWNIKLVIKTIKVLRTINLITISGSTKGRKILCNTIADIHKVECHVKKIINRNRVDFKKEEIKKIFLKV